MWLVIRRDIFFFFCDCLSIWDEYFIGEKRLFEFGTMIDCLVDLVGNQVLFDNKNVSSIFYCTFCFETLDNFIHFLSPKFYKQCEISI